MKIRKVLPAGLVLLALAAACSKNNDDAEKTRLTVKLTDNPFNATAVNVDIQQVLVKMSDDDNPSANSDNKGNWVNLSTTAGVYNLLQFQNGVTTNLAAGDVPEGIVREMRLVLGGNNSIEIAGQTYTLTIPSGAETGLKIKVDRLLNASADEIVVDFDAALSIKQNGTGDYRLVPVLKLK